MSTGPSIHDRLAQGLALLLTVVLLGGCVGTDPEYAHALASARTDCKGNEIVGVWTWAKPGWATVLLFRPDGTGLHREMVQNNAAMSQTVPVLWHYQGAGVWTAGTSTLRFAGNSLAVEEPGARLVYLRAGNESLNEVMNPHP